MSRLTLQPALLKRLRCPSCEREIVSATPQPIEFGTVGCACGEYAVIAGILLLSRGSIYESLIAALEARDRARVEELVCEHFQVPPILLQPHATTYLHAMEHYVRECPDRAKGEYEWLLHAKYWNATGKYLAALRLMPSVAIGSDAAFLDLACGFGHLTRLYQPRLYGRSGYLLERELIHLVLAAALLPAEVLANTCRVAMDIRDRLPLMPGSLDLIINSDAFYVFTNQAEVLRSCRETLSKDGRLLFTHLHNHDRPDEPFQYNSHDKEGWRALFERNLSTPVSVLSDDALRASLFAGESVRVATVLPDNPRSFSVLAPALSELPRFQPDPQLLDRLAPNPVYDIQASDHALRLVRRELSRLFEEEHEPARFFPDLTLPQPGLLESTARSELYCRGILVRPP